MPARAEFQLGFLFGRRLGVGMGRGEEDAVGRRLEKSAGRLARAGRDARRFAREQVEDVYLVEGIPRLALALEDQLLAVRMKIAFAAPLALEDKLPRVREESGFSWAPSSEADALGLQSTEARMRQHKSRIAEFASLVSLRGARQQKAHLVVAGLREIFVELPDAPEPIRGEQGHRFVGHPFDFAKSVGWTNRDRGGDLGRPLFPQRRNGRQHACSRRQPVIDQNHDAPANFGRRPISAIITLTALQFRASRVVTWPPWQTPPVSCATRPHLRRELPPKRSPPSRVPCIPAPPIFGRRKHRVAGPGPERLRRQWEHPPAATPARWHLDAAGTRATPRPAIGPLLSGRGKRFASAGKVRVNCAEKRIGHICLIGHIYPDE